jgi:hypothetical protein
MTVPFCTTVRLVPAPQHQQGRLPNQNLNKMHAALAAQLFFAISAVFGHDKASFLVVT